MSITRLAGIVSLLQCSKCSGDTVVRASSNPKVQVPSMARAQIVFFMHSLLYLSITVSNLCSYVP